MLAVTEDEACLWDIRTGQQRLVFECNPGAGNSTTCGALSRDGRTLLIAENDSRLCVFDTASGRRKAELKAGDRTFAAALSSDGRLAASREGEDVILWDVNQMKEIRRFTFGKLIAVRFSPDDRYLAIASGTAEKEMWIQDIAGHDAPRKLEGAFTGSSAWFDFSPDGKILAGSAVSGLGNSYHELVMAWNTETGRKLFSRKDGSYHGVFSPDGRWLATSTSGEVMIFDAVTGEKVKQLIVGHDSVRALAFSPDGKTLATGMDRRIQLWNTETWEERDPGSGHSEPVQTLAFSPDGRTIVSGGLDGALILWSWPEGKERKRLEKLGSFRGVQCTAFSPNGRQIAVSAWVNYDDTFFICDVASGTMVTKFGKEHQGYGATFSADGKQILTGNSEGAIGVWDAASAKWLRQVGHAQGNIYALQPLPGGEKVWWAGDYQGLGLRNLNTGEDERILSGGLHSMGAILIVSPDESWLAVGSRAWALKAGEVISHERGSETVAAMSPDGRLLAFGYAEEMVLWEALTRQVIHRAPLGRGDVKALAFSPDGTVLAVASNADVFLWDVTGQLRDRQLPKLELAQAEMEGLWQMLGDDVALAAHRAAWTLSAGGDAAVEFLRGRLRAAVSLSPEEVEALRATFRNPDYDLRDHAARELVDRGIALRFEDREALRRPQRMMGSALGEPQFFPGPVPELSPLPGRVRASRAVMALEHSTAASAESLLEKLSEGAAESPLTREAKSALDRVRQRHQK